MTILYNIIFKSNILHSRLTADEAADKLEEYAFKFYEQQGDPTDWALDPKDLTTEEIIDAG